MIKPFFGFILVFICTIQIASGQVAQNTWGLGVGLASGSTVFHVPIVLERIRIEPEISFRGSSSNSAHTTTYSQDNASDAYSYSNSSQSISLASGFYYTFPIDKIADWYIGPRVGLTFNSSTSDYNDIYSDTSFQRVTINHMKQHSMSYFAGAVFGGEYYFSSHFTVGAELLITYSFTGQPTIENTNTVTPPYNNYNSISIPGPSSSYTIGESTAVYIRWYF